MTTRTNLRVLDLLLEESEDGGSDDLTVVAAVSDWFPADLDLMEAAVMHHGGVFLDAADGTDGVLGSVDPGLQATVEALPIQVVGGTDLNLRVTERDGLVHASFEGSSTPTNTGHRTVLGLVACLFAADLREHEFAVVCWDETALDVVLADWCWELVSNHLASLDFGGLRGLIVMARSNRPQILRHCVGDVSARVVVSGDDYWQRKTSSDNRAASRNLVSPTDPLVLFLAAGFSVSSGLPTGDDLLVRAIRTLTGSTSWNRDELASDFHGWLRRHHAGIGDELDNREHFIRTLTLERVLREEWALHHEASPTLVYLDSRHEDALRSPGRAVRRLHDLCLMRKAIVVTVNFDELVEEVFGADELVVFASEEDFASAPEYIAQFCDGTRTATPLLKLHGTWSRPETLIFRQEQTLVGLPAPLRAALAAVRDRGTESHLLRWVYIGSSMRDMDVVSEIHLQDYGERLDEWWVSPLPAREIARFAALHRDEIWRRTGRKDARFRLITEVADVFLAWLVEAD